ncbi:Conidiation protein 6-domain-containing protein [Lyophyllum atratum]|nr:Conidiation protein 6-domain-containing protein [Lyophyllum atratum]KAF8065158.1 Conidiation protein 6-domain-containing protein [Lyophyllum atratum]
MSPVTSDYGKNPERVAAGLKATMKNPNVSEEAKISAKERLEDMSDEVPNARTPSRVSRSRSRRRSTSRGRRSASAESTNRVLGGYKATLRNPNTSEEAKRHAREILDAYEYGEEDEGDERAHNSRVIAGYKAALHNPRVSPEAKQHAREFLEANNAL